MTEPVWELLNDLEDSISTGYRISHTPPVVSIPAITEDSARPCDEVENVDQDAATVCAEADMETQGCSAVAQKLASSGKDIKQVSSAIRSCKACNLHSFRKNAVPGTGSLHPLLLVVSSFPCADDDKVGLPFVGHAGQYLDKWLKPVGLSRYRNVYITSLVKCRPPQNRGPLAEETEICIQYFIWQIQLLQPSMMLITGRSAARILFRDSNNTNEAAQPAEPERGKVHTCFGLPTIVTYHPGEVLRNQALRKDVWNDLQVMRDHLRSIRADYQPPAV